MEVATPSAVPDVLGPGLDVVFCGINPGRVSDAARAHFANPRNDLWRLLEAAGFTPRLYDPSEQFALLPLRIGITNAAYRTTPCADACERGSSPARRAWKRKLVSTQRLSPASSRCSGVHASSSFGISAPPLPLRATHVSSTETS